MAKLVGALAALIALSAGILAQVNSILCLQRAAVAYAVGWFGTQLWYVFFTVRVQTPVPKAKVSQEEEESEVPLAA